MTTLDVCSYPPPRSRSNCTSSRLVTWRWTAWTTTPLQAQLQWRHDLSRIWQDVIRKKRGACGWNNDRAPSGGPFARPTRIGPLRPWSSFTSCNTSATRTSTTSETIFELGFDMIGDLSPTERAWSSPVEVSWYTGCMATRTACVRKDSLPASRPASRGVRLDNCRPMRGRWRGVVSPCSWRWGSAPHLFLDVHIDSL